MAEWIALLESNSPRAVEDAKQKFHEQFNIVQDSWLLNGLYDYYLSSNSARSMEILVNVREPHHSYLFNKLSDSIRGSKTDTKVQALTLLGHVLRKQPPWLYKITEHQLLRDILKLLKTETDILLLLSALLVLVVLLPIVPSLMGQFLQDVFEVFSRLAAWNCNNPGKLIEEQMLHMQIALYALFQRLYGMYPCNFLAYLRNQYRNKEQIPIFMHTVKPMLDTVKMHPLLVTASKDKETTTERWKKMGAHDVIVECERFSLDVGDRCSHESCYLTTSFRSRSGTMNSGNFDSTYQLQSLKNTPIAHLVYEGKDFFSPSMMFQSQTPPVPDSSAPTNIPLTHIQGVGQGLGINAGLPSQEGTSPPEAAIEATPETTPIKDMRLPSRSLPQNSSVVRALTSLNSRNWSVGSSSTTPSHSQPSSPMRKEISPFNFSSDMKHTSAFGLPRRDSVASQKLQRIIQDRSQVADVTTDTNLRSKTPVLHPISPLRIIPTSDTHILSSSVQRIDSPVSLEDEEVLEIVRQGELERQLGLRQCDSVLQEIDGSRGMEEDLDDCEQEHGSPCTAGGLHMPNSRSMNDFAKHVRRLRYHSQCGAEPELPEISTGSSPGNSVYIGYFEVGVPFPVNTTVRRANSCPEMKKSPVVPTKDNISKTLIEIDEEANKENVVDNKLAINGLDGRDFTKDTQKCFSTIETQTDNFWPMPYEHLFLGIFPSLENTDIKPSPAPSPAPLNVQQEKFSMASPYEMLDRYIDVGAHCTEKDAGKCLREQIQLLHQQLLFERHRRETHAFRNRRLLADSRRTKALEEHNSALRDQVQLQQRDIDNLKDQLELLKKDKHFKGKQISETVQYWEDKCLVLQDENKILKQQSEDMHKELDIVREKCLSLDNKWQQAEAFLLDAKAEVKIAKEQAWAGEKGKAELAQVSKELLLAGELQLRYQERLSQLPLLKRSEQELARLTEASNSEFKTLHQQLEAKSTMLEACRTRISELEHLAIQNEESSSIQKRLLSEVKEECDEKLKAVESKYQTQLAINRSIEERVLELWQRIELSNRHAVHSPDTSSCHEVHATTTDRTSVATGLSPHSSPLSASLASSEGSVPFAHGDGKEMKNLQIIVDQKESVMVASKPLSMEESCVVSEPGTSQSQSSAFKHD